MQLYMHYTSSCSDILHLNWVWDYLAGVWELGLKGFKRITPTQGLGYQFITMRNLREYILQSPYAKWKVCPSLDSKIEISSFQWSLQCWAQSPDRQLPVVWIVQRTLLHLSIFLGRPVIQKKDRQGWPPTKTIPGGNPNKPSHGDKEFNSRNDGEWWLSQSKPEGQYWRGLGISSVGWRGTCASALQTLKWHTVLSLYVFCMCVQLDACRSVNAPFTVSLPSQPHADWYLLWAGLCSRFLPKWEFLPLSP